MSAANKGSKAIKVLGIIALVGVVIAIARLIVRGVRSAKSEPEDEHNGI